MTEIARLRAALEHELKVWLDYFPALADGRKTFEVRKNDRDYRVGDTLILKEYAPGPDEFTGRQVTRRVVYMLSGDDPMGYAFGLRPGFVALALAAPADAELFDLGNGLAVYCNAGGRFHGWLFRKHPDGQYISLRKLESIANPFRELTQ